MSLKALMVRDPCPTFMAIDGLKCESPGPAVAIQLKVAASECIAAGAHEQIRANSSEQQTGLLLPETVTPYLAAKGA